MENFFDKLLQDEKFRSFSNDINVTLTLLHNFF